jgi:hypothetical protein
MTARTYVLAFLVAAACGDKAAPKPPPPEPKAPIRGAAGDHDLRLFLAELAEKRGCKVMEGQFRALRDPARPDVVTGVLWMRGCRFHQQGTDVTVDLSTQGWQWQERDKKKAGAKFELAQVVKFAADIHMPGALDVGYDPKNHIASIWLSPAHVPDVRFSPIGKLEVEEQGAWAETVGVLGSVVGMSPESQAEDEAKSDGKHEMRSQLADGLGATINACTGLARNDLGRPPRGAMYAAGVGESTRIAVEVHPTSVYLSGPYFAPKGMNITVDVEQGSVRAALVCRDQGEVLAAAFIDGRDLPDVKTLAVKDVDNKATLHIGPQRCQVDILVRAIPDATGAPARFNWRRATSEWAESTGGPLVDC